MKVSIIIPCYNQGQYLPEALQSILEQTYQNWECIIVNDGSTDNTEQVAQEWLEKDARFKYAYKENVGLSSARNTGLDFAKGDFIQFLDSDDFLAPEKLILSVESFQENYTIDVVITDYNIFNSRDLQNNRPFYEISNIHFNFETIVNNWDIDFTIPIHCALFKRSSIGNLRFNENLKAKEDWLFWIQFFKKSSNVTFIHQQLVSYRKHDNSMTQSAKYMQESQSLILVLIKEELSSEEYEIFLLKRLKFYKERYFENALKYSKLNNSLTYRFALKLKSGIYKMGMLTMMKTILQKLRK